MEDFEAHNSRPRLALLFLGTVVFFLCGLWMVGAFGEVPSSRRYPAALLVIVGWFTVVFCGVGAIVFLKQWFDRSAQLQIGPSGIRWCRWSDQTIPWSEIMDVTTWSSRGQKTIILHLRNPARYPGHGILGKTAGANRMLAGGDIHISLIATDRSYHEAMLAIEHFRN